ncbi:MAG: hypothetical protein ACTSRI_17680 [Promethearchaeota archaeon]
MNEDHEKDREDDLQAYLSEMEKLETDFSDLDDLNMEELKEMQEAIEIVKERQELSEEILIDDTKDAGIVTDEKDELDYLEQKEAMITDFSDIDEIDFDELRDMKAAIESVKQEELQPSQEGKEQIQTKLDVSQELEDRIKQELLKKKIKEEEKVITPEKFLNYVKDKRDKIWYHSLYYIVFDAEDHVASKTLLYDILKEITSKSAIDPIPEHQFYFGLGYILRLSINNKQVVRYMSGGKFKINVSIKMITEILEKAGAPISNRPVIEESKKKEMYSDFLKDDFLDI